MNRRGFLSGILAAGAAPFVVRASSLMPVIRVATVEEVALIDANSGLTIQMITREALRVLHKNMDFMTSTNRAYDKAFDRLVIRRPEPYRVSIA